MPHNFLYTGIPHFKIYLWSIMKVLCAHYIASWWHKLNTMQSQWNNLWGNRKIKHLIQRIRYPKQTPKSNKTGSLDTSVHSYIAHIKFNTCSSEQCYAPSLFLVHLKNCTFLKLFMIHNENFTCLISDHDDTKWTQWNLADMIFAETRK